MRRIGILLMASFCLSGCGFFGGGSPDREGEAQATANASQPEHAGQAAPQVVDSPALASARALWKGIECTDARNADTQLTAILATAKGQEHNAQQSEALALRGLARSELGMKDEAFEDLTAAVRQNPVARNYAWRGLVLLRNGNARGAQIDAHYALRKDKAQPVAHLVLGLTALQAGDTAAACPELRAACNGGECSGLNEAQAAGSCPR